MIPYNTSEAILVLPEYGRNIQRLIDHCVMIEDKEERTRCAYAIADVMATLFPSIVGEKGNRQKIWDHINIMSKFETDIDFPCEVIDKDQLSPTPSKIPYNSNLNRYRHYGKNIQEMIIKVADMENCVEKDQLIFLVANQMKKLLLIHNPENVSSEKVFADIAEISKGKILIDSGSYRLNEYIDASPASNGKNKKEKEITKLKLIL